MLPNCADSVLQFSQWLDIYKATQVNVDGSPDWEYDHQRITACIQEVDPARLRINEVDFSLIYLVVHILPPKVRNIREFYYVDRDGNMYLNRAGEEYTTREGKTAYVYGGLKINDRCIYKTQIYKCIDVYFSADYGFIEVTFEQEKKPSLELKKAVNNRKCKRNFTQ
jgi:hypothetical protein